MYTIDHLAKNFGLSRSTLLYYDSIGLFSPSGRSASNYRTYTEGDRDGGVSIVQHDVIT